MQPLPTRCSWEGRRHGSPLLGQGSALLAALHLLACFLANSDWRRQASANTGAALTARQQVHDQPCNGSAPGGLGPSLQLHWEHNPLCSSALGCAPHPRTRVQLTPRALNSCSTAKVSQQLNASVTGLRMRSPPWRLSGPAVGATSFQQQVHLEPCHPVLHLPEAACKHSKDMRPAWIRWSVLAGGDRRLQAS